MSGGTFDHNLDGITDGQGVAWDSTEQERAIGGRGALAA